MQEAKHRMTFAVIADGVSVCIGLHVDMKKILCGVACGTLHGSIGCTYLGIDCSLSENIVCFFVGLRSVAYMKT